MLLKYETGIATFIQFVVLSLLNIINVVGSTVSQCGTGHSDCVWGAFANMVFIILIVLWFGFLWVLGFAAQDRRSKRLAQALILAECMVAIVALFNFKHGHETFARLTSLFNLIMAVYVILLAFRIARAKGGRVVVRGRARVRNLHRNTPTEL